MTFEEFDKFQGDLLAEVVAMKSTKGREYANSADRFANFHRLSDQLGIKDYQVGWVYGAKHLDSIASFMKNGETYSAETIRGRFVDAITYLTLIAGMVQEAEEYKQRKAADLFRQLDTNSGKHQPFEFDPRAPIGGAR